MHVLMDLQCVLAASLVHALSLSDEILAEAKVEREQVGAEGRAHAVQIKRRRRSTTGRPGSPFCSAPIAAAF